MLEFLESWSTPLIAVGVSQLVFSFGLLGPGAVAIAGCAQYYHVSFALIPALFLFGTGAATISGFKVPFRRPIRFPFFMCQQDYFSAILGCCWDWD